MDDTMGAPQGTVAIVAYIYSFKLFLLSCITDNPLVPKKSIFYRECITGVYKQLRLCLPPPLWTGTLLISALFDGTYILCLRVFAELVHSDTHGKVKSSPHSRLRRLELKEYIIYFFDISTNLFKL